MKKLARKANPAWIDTALTAGWPTFADSAAPPVVSRVGKKVHANELGCGHYGCVLRTSDPATVLKITSDPTEAAFVMLLLKKSMQEDGIVHYHSTVKVPGLRRGRELFAIWRESAYDVGNVVSPYIKYDTGYDEYTNRVLQTFQRRLHSFQQRAGEIRLFLKKKSDPWEIVDYAFRALENGAPEHSRVYLDNQDHVTYDYRGMDAKRRVSILLKACEVNAQMIANEPKGYLVGQALENMLSEGVLLADVHSGNIGHVDREDHERAIVITDPGHALFLKRDLADEAVRLAGLTERSRPAKLAQP